MLTITKKQLCRDRNNGRILTPDGLWFICEAYEYDPEKNRKTFSGNTAKGTTERELRVY